jgi:hypothetical protein
MAEAPVPDRPNIHNQLATGLEGSLGSNAQRRAERSMIARRRRHFCGRVLKSQRHNSSQMKNNAPAMVSLATAQHVPEYCQRDDQQHGKGGWIGTRLAQLRDFDIASCLINADRTHNDGKQSHERPSHRRAGGERASDDPDAKGNDTYRD